MPQRTICPKTKCTMDILLLIFDKLVHKNKQLQQSSFHFRFFFYFHFHFRRLWNLHLDTNAVRRGGKRFTTNQCIQQTASTIFLSLSLFSFTFTFTFIACGAFICAQRGKVIYNKPVHATNSFNITNESLVYRI